jgi:hypothetical protein
MKPRISDAQSIYFDILHSIDIADKELDELRLTNNEGDVPSIQVDKDPSSLYRTALKGDIAAGERLLSTKAVEKLNSRSALNEFEVSKASSVSLRFIKQTLRKQSVDGSNALKLQQSHYNTPH